MEEQKIKQDAIHIGQNIRRIRKQHGVGQTELISLLDRQGINMTRETLVKIERGTQHIQATQLRGIRDVLHASYDELLERDPEDRRRQFFLQAEPEVLEKLEHIAQSYHCSKNDALLQLIQQWVSPIDDTHGEIGLPQEQNRL